MTSTSDKFKFPEPREFNGKKCNAETWILKLEEYFGARGVQCNNGSTSVTDITYINLAAI
jgi:hypothetical protein